MPKRKHSFYGVGVGNKPGVYEDWEDCKRQVHGFSGSQYKAFSTRSEAENYVQQFFTGSQTTAIRKKQFIQTCFQSSANIEKNTNQPWPEKTTNPEKDISQPCSQNVAIPMKVVIPPQYLSTMDRSKLFKLVEENGQQFVVFESLKDFDMYFESHGHSNHLENDTWNMKTSTAEQTIGCQEQTSNSSRPSQTKVTTEDRDFMYFEDEDELEIFLEPYFKDNSKQGSTDPARICPNSDGAGQETFSSALQGVYQVEFDGASKGNPGTAGAGALLRCPHGCVVLELAEFLGRETNNVAEYRSLILGLKGALSKGVRRVRAQGDSKLVCLQVIGAWKVENKKLIPLHEEVKRLEKLFEEFSIAHVKREYNSAADALANDAVCLGGSEPVREISKPLPKCCA